MPRRSLSASQGHAGRQFRLGLIYEEGRDAEQDYCKARENFALETNQGHSDSQYRLGTPHYEFGKGVEQDFEKAVYFY